MTEPITGSVAEVLDSYRIVVNRGENDGVTESMRFRVFENRRITDPDRQRPSRTLDIDKAVVKPETIYEKMTLMETETESYSVPITQALSKIPEFSKMSRTKRNKIKTDSDIEDDVEIVRPGDSVEQIVDTDESEVGEDSPSES